MASPQTIHAVIENDRAGKYSDWEDFDDALWTALLPLIDLSSPETIFRLPEAVWVYFATRLLEWEVGNGSFAQAAVNFPEWFEPAAKGNEVLGKPNLASFIRAASQLIDPASQQISDLQDGSEEGPFEVFDDQLEDLGWECGEDRIQHVRSHRDQFSSL